MSQSSRWKLQGGMNRRPNNNIITNNTSHSNILNTRTFGTANTTIEKVADLRDVETASIYRFDPNKTNFANVICYYPFNDLSYNTPLPSETTNTDISNQSLAGNLPTPQPFPLVFKDPSIGGTFYKPKVAYNDSISQHVVQLDHSSQVLTTDLSFNTKNAYDTSGSTISAALTMSCFVNILDSDVSTTPGQSNQFCLFAMDDLSQNALQKFTSSPVVDGSDNLLYLWYPNKNGKAQLLNGYKGDLSGASWSYSSKESPEQIPTNKWTQVFLVLAGLSIYVIVDGKVVITSSGSELQGASYVPDQPFNINLGPYYYDYDTDVSANLLTTNTARPLLSDCKLANTAVGPQLASALASEEEYGHQYSVNEEPNKSGFLYYLLSKDLVSFSAPTLFRSDLNLGGDLQSYGTNNFYGQSNFYTKTYFANGIIADGSSTIVYDSNVGNLNIYSETLGTTKKNASLLITNSSETGSNPIHDFMASMLVFNDNDDIYNNVQKSNLPAHVDKLQFSISGENVSVGHGFGDSSFNVFGDSVMDGNLSFTNGYIGISQDTTTGPIRIGNAAGQITQGINSVAIGSAAGQITQGTGSIALGINAGNNTQGTGSVALGINAGNITQGTGSVAIGNAAGYNTQETGSVALGINAGNITQGAISVAIGSGAGYNAQGAYSVAIGSEAGKTDQGAISVAIGSGAGNNLQGANSVAIGSTAGQITQGINSVAIGPGAGSINQYQYSVAIGYNAGITDQSKNCVAIGNAAGQITQGQYSVAMGLQAGQTTQGTNSVAIGQNAGQTSQGVNSVAIGKSAGSNNQRENSVAMGLQAGKNNQGLQSVAIGYYAGQISQGQYSVAMGLNAGQMDQSGNSVAIGHNAGSSDQSGNSVAIGHNAAKTGQGEYSVAIGYNTKCQNNSSVALGSGATTTAPNQIVLGTLNETVLIPGELDVSNNSLRITTTDSNCSLLINEEIGTTLTTTTGSLIISHGDRNGQSSILFPSTRNSTDYAAIQYQETDPDGVPDNEKGILRLICENDATTNHEDQIRFKTSNGDRMTIGGSGNVGIGTTSPITTLEVVGDISASSINTSSFSGNPTFNGTVTAVSFNATSDVRLKENITNLDNSLDKICNIRGVNYNWKNDETKTKTAGVIAQEVLEQIPEAVIDSDSEKLSVNYNSIIAHLIESVKTLKQEVDDLKGQLKK